jgi:hypothetical protein
MDFIERLFGLAPDQGSGLIEASLFVASLAGLYLAWRLSSATKKPSVPADRGVSRR